MLNRIGFLTPFAVLSVLSQAQGAEISMRADRERIRLGEHALVTITVRKSAYRPVVTPPTVPYCKIELAGERQTRPTTPQRGTAKSGPAGTNQRLGQALSELDKRLEKLPGELARQSGGDTSILSEHTDMLRDIRRQAIQALNSGAGPSDYEIQFRVTPQRSGELSLPPFLVKMGPQAVQTGGIKLTIEPATTRGTGDSAASASPSVGGNASLERSEARAGTAARGFSFEPWHWALVLLAGPLVGGIAYLLVGRRREDSQRPEQSAIAVPVAMNLQQRVATARSTDEVVRFVTEMVRVRCRLPAGEVTPTEACVALQESGVSTELAERVAALLDECTAARFAPEPIAVFSREIVHAARTLVAELECESLVRP